MTRMHTCCRRLLPNICLDGVALFPNTKHCQKKMTSIRQMFSIYSHLSNTERQFSVSTFKQYDIIQRLKLQDDVNLKKDAVNIFNASLLAVHPKTMIQNTLKYNEATSELKVADRLYHVDKNVFVVGFGKAAMGMARAVEDILSQHVVTGIISIPKGLHVEMANLQLHEMLLSRDTKIQVYEGAHDEADVTSHNAAKAIHRLVKKLTDKDLLIVLCSEGGSILCPSPHPPITLQELCHVTRLLKSSDASWRELNIVRKNIEILKGGGLAMEAQPAKVLSLVVCNVLGNSADLISSGPTYSTQPAPHHCIEILKRLKIMDQISENVRSFLEKDCIKHDNTNLKSANEAMSEKATSDAVWQHVQNVVVGDNSIACEAAASKAIELGYVPHILTTTLAGDAKDVGHLYAKLAKFIAMCFDRKASFEPNSDLAILETTLVAGGLRKAWINTISKKVDMARNSDRDICIIAGGRIVASVHGTDTMVKNMESALAAAVHMQREFKVKKPHLANSRMCFLSCDTDVHEHTAKMAGVVVDHDLLQEVVNGGIDLKKYLDNNDSFTLFSQVCGGQNLVASKFIGINVMDIVILLVQRPDM